MDEADVADLVAALAYVLRFDGRGKPRKGGWESAVSARPTCPVRFQRPFP